MSLRAAPQAWVPLPVPGGAAAGEGGGGRAPPSPAEGLLDARAGPVSDARLRAGRWALQREGGERAAAQT